MDKKYICHGGLVKSKDGDYHFVTAPELPALYGVNPKECYFQRQNGSLNMSGWTKEYYLSLKHLYPRDDGKYEQER